jgi:hypothetical protein
MTKRLSSSLACAALLQFAPAAHAAGGHFDVDDATLLAPRRCQVEAWWLRAPAANAGVWHLGPACRVGPVELGLNAERVAATDGHRDLVGPQLKWATNPALGPVALGIVAAAGFDVSHGGRTAWTIYAPLTWNAITDVLALNLNFGIDRGAVGPRTRRVGASVEWVLNEKFTVLAERGRVGGEWASRLGARIALGDASSLDISAARAGPQAVRVYAIGLNHEFGR